MYGICLLIYIPLICVCMVICLFVHVKESWVIWHQMHFNPVANANQAKMHAIWGNSPLKWMGCYGHCKHELVIIPLFCSKTETVRCMQFDEMYLAFDTTRMYLYLQCSSCMYNVAKFNQWTLIFYFGKYGFCKLFHSMMW